MQDDAFVVVFPSEFSKPKMPQLISNIKKILKTAGQKFEFVRRDGDIVIVGANDPVLASSAINQLFGISRIAIARRADPDLRSIVAEVTRLGGSLLLRGERFLVKVEGSASGFVPKDAEIAITSSIIEKKSEQGAAPGTENRYDKLLYTYITKKSAYVCIFLDDGHGGAVNFSLQRQTLCPIYDEVSAVSCIEAIRQGYDVKIIVPYKKRSELVKIAKLLNRVIRFTAQEDVELEFYNFGPGSRVSNQLDWQSSMVRLCIIVAANNRVSRISLPVTNQIFPVGFVDSMCEYVIKSGLCCHIPLEGRENDIRGMAKTYVLEKFFGRIKPQRGSKFADISETRFGDNARIALKTRRVISVRLGPNNLHDILDALEQ